MIRFITVLVTIAMILLLAITFIQVIFRYFLHVSIGGVGELPVYMMMLCIRLTAAVNAKRKGQITLDIYTLFVTNKKARLIIETITTFLSTVAFTILAISFTEFTTFLFRRGTRTGGVLMPYWTLSSVILFSIALSVIYYAIHVKNGIKELIKWK